MAVDLTRFDFQAKRFLFSESVRQMDASEVGQYILLMCEAWMGGKEATLPDNLAYLARLARVPEVSPAVLAMFPIIETDMGTRRRNETLYEEWLEAKARSEAGLARVAGRGGPWADTAKERGASKLFIPAKPVETGRAAVNTAANTTAGPVNAPPYGPPYYPTQANPTQANPNQTKPGPGSQVGVAFQAAWPEIRRRYRQIFGNKPDKALFENKYLDACRTFGQDVVMACFEQWAPTAVDWARRDGIKHPLHSFFKKLPTLAPDEVESQAEVKEEAEQAAQRVAELKREEAVIEQNVQRQKDEHRALWTAEDKPQNGDGASVLDYLAELEQEQN